MKTYFAAVTLALLALTHTSSAYAVSCRTSASDFHPTVMLGLTYNFGGGGNATENLGLTAKLLSTNEANHFVLGGGVSYFPGAKDKDKLGLDAGIGFNGSHATGLVGYDVLRQGPSVSAGWAPTSEEKHLACVG